MLLFVINRDSSWWVAIYCSWCLFMFMVMFHEFPKHEYDCCDMICCLNPIRQIINWSNCEMLLVLIEVRWIKTKTNMWFVGCDVVWIPIGEIIDVIHVVVCAFQWCRFSCDELPKWNCYLLDVTLFAILFENIAVWLMLPSLIRFMIFEKHANWNVICGYDLISTPIWNIINVVSVEMFWC